MEMYMKGILTEFVAETAPVFVAGYGKHDVEVIGTSRYQKYLQVLRKRHLNKDREQPLIAKLHYENNHPYDKNAIRVVINGGKVGYLSREDAKFFRKRIERAGQEGTIISCNARIIGGTRAWLGKTPELDVFLDLPLLSLLPRSNFQF